MGEQNLVLIGGKDEAGGGDNGGQKILFGILIAVLMGCAGGYIYFQATNNTNRSMYPPPEWYQQQGYNQPQANMQQNQHPELQKAAGTENQNGIQTESPAAAVEVTEASGLWLDWTAWAGCSVTCGGGANYRSRTCTAGHVCAGDNHGWELCNQQCCQIDGQWNEWTEWAPRESNLQTRFRTCSKPEPSCGGKTCTGQATETRRLPGNTGNTGNSAAPQAPVNPQAPQAAQTQQAPVAPVVAMRV